MLQLLPPSPLSTAWDTALLVDAYGRSMLHYLAMAAGTASAARDAGFWVDNRAVVAAASISSSSSAHFVHGNDPLMNCVHFLGNVLDCYKPLKKFTSSRSSIVMDEGDGDAADTAKIAAEVGPVDATTSIKAGWLKKKRGGFPWQATSMLRMRTATRRYTLL